VRVLISLPSRTRLWYRCLGRGHGSNASQVRCGRAAAYALIFRRRRSGKEYG